MNLPHVFAKATVSTADLGYPYIVHGGAHYLADDPIVTARPDLFTTDCRYGLAWSGSQPPQCLTVPPDPDDESGEAMTARVRSRSQAERARAARG